MPYYYKQKQNRHPLDRMPVGILFGFDVDSIILYSIIEYSIFIFTDTNSVVGVRLFYIR